MNEPNMKKRIAVCFLLLLPIIAAYSAALVLPVSADEIEINQITNPVLGYDSGAGEMLQAYVTPLKGRGFIDTDSYVFGCNAYGAGSYTCYWRTMVTDDEGLTWDDGTGNFIGNGYNRDPFGSGYFDIAMNSTGSSFIISGRHTSSGTTHYIDYYSCVPSELTGLWLAAYGTEPKVTIDASGYARYVSPAICMIDDKPILATSTEADTRTLEVWFADTDTPNDGDFTVVSKEIYSYFGSFVGCWLYVEPISDTEVLVFFSMTKTATKVYGFTANTTAISEPFIVVDEDVNTYFYDSTYDWYQMMFNVYSENQMNSSVIDDEIAFAWINTENEVYFNTIDCDTLTVGTPSLLHNETAFDDAQAPTVLKDADTYFVTWTGEADNVAETSAYLVAARHPDTLSWSVQSVYNCTDDRGVQDNNAMAISKVRLGSNNVFYGSFMNSTDDCYLFQIDLVGIWATEETTPDHSWFGYYSDFFIGLLGVLLMAVSPSWLALKLRKEGLSGLDMTLERAIFALLLFAIGFAMMLGWVGGNFWGSS